MVEEKIIKKQKRKKISSKKDEEFILEEVVLDIEQLDIGGVNTTEKEKRFIFWYTYPSSEAFMSQTRAARKAGYAQPEVQGYRLRRKDNVAKAIRYVLNSYLRVNLEEEFHKILAMKKQRIFYDIGDYVEKKERTCYTKSGEPYSMITEELKDISDLTPEQRMAIDSIDYKGNDSKKVYVFVNRDKAMNDLIMLRNAVNGEVEKESEEDNIEFTAEIIKEGLRVKATTTRKKKDEIRRAVSFLDSANDGSEEL